MACTLADFAGVSVVGQCGTGRDAMALVTEQTIDVLVLDWRIPDGGTALIADLRQRRQAMKILILSADDTAATVGAALQAGASGYLVKSSGGNELAAVIRRLADGEPYVSPELAARLLTVRPERVSRPTTSVDDLSARETDIIRRVAEGQTNKEVARTLKISEKTVKHYMTTIMQKLHVRNRVEACAMVLRFSQEKVDAD
jgi:DNA-binding NarL/FixJ family response regulator